MFIISKYLALVPISFFFFYLSISTMSSIFRYYLYTLFYFLTLYIIIHTRSINENNTVELIVNNQELLIKLTNYRHRFEHSINLKKIRWIFKHRYNKTYCEFCNLVVPVVRDFFEFISTKICLLYLF